MPVFISHKQEDSAEAAELHRYFTSRGVPAYVDLLEIGQPGLKSDEDITNRILDRLSKCTHLMAIVSGVTRLSWWVPFEIGIATNQGNRISSLNYKQLIDLPEYLKIWPVLRTREHLDRYIALYKADGTAQKAFTDSAQATRTASDFHRQMKSITGQLR
jgi:TIR domain